MGMRYFSLLTDTRIDIRPHTPYREPTKNNRTFLMPTAKEVTLAEYSPASSDAITAHRLSDYRRRRFSLTLLPNVHILLDDLLVPVSGADVSM